MTQTTSGGEGEDVELIEQLRAPERWCCIFEHEGQMRHGTTDAPFKAADRLTAKPVTEANGLLIEALQFYAAESGWNEPPIKTVKHEIFGEAYENQASKVRLDRGRIARDALAKLAPSLSERGERG